MFGLNSLLERFAKDVDDKFKYKIKLLDDTEMQFILIYNAKGKVLDSVFNQVKKGLVGQIKGIKDKNPENIDSFIVPDRFNTRIHTAVKRNLVSLEKLVYKDGYKIIRTSVNRCTFEKKEGILYITVEAVGQYVRN